jgi:hypothetical protein
MNRREKDTEQRHQQIDFHGVLPLYRDGLTGRPRRYDATTKVFLRFNDTRVITNG